jgi:branched-chain amino acid transport system permease protein
MTHTLPLPDFTHERVEVLTGRRSGLFITVALHSSVLGSALGGAGGVLVGLYYTQIDFFMGYSAGLKAFTAAVLGGIGNIRGAMLGGLILGLVESLAVTFLNPAYKDVVAFAILILTLVVRPAGLLGESVPESEKV